MYAHAQTTGCIFAGERHREEMRGSAFACSHAGEQLEEPAVAVARAVCARARRRRRRCVRAAACALLQRHHSRLRVD
jgi:hypothetical protein